MVNNLHPYRFLSAGIGTYILTFDPCYFFKMLREQFNTAYFSLLKDLPDLSEWCQNCMLQWVIAIDNLCQFGMLCSTFSLFGHNFIYNFPFMLDFALLTKIWRKISVYYRYRPCENHKSSNNGCTMGWHISINSPFLLWIYILLINNDQLYTTWWTHVIFEHKWQ